MFDRLITWFSPERRARIAFPLELAVGAFFALAALLNAQWWGGWISTLFNVGFAVCIGVAVATHRTQPALALSTLSVFATGLVIAVTGIWAFNGWAVSAAAVAVFGA